MLRGVSNVPFVSYGQNHEDVILWRALSHVTDGTYVDVGAADPEELSVTKALYERGWSGLNIEALPDMAAQLRRARPRDITVQVAVGTATEPTVTFHELVGTGLSTLVGTIAEQHEQAGFVKRDIEVPTSTLNRLLEENGFAGRQIHFLKVDVEGAEADVLRSIDFSVWRPWVLVIEATAPNSPEPTHEEWEPYVLDSGYEWCLFDGISRYYVAKEHAEELRPKLSYPACVLDDFIPVDVHELKQTLARTEARWREAGRWRAAALQTWARSAQTANEIANLRRLLASESAELTRLRGEAHGAHLAVANLQKELAALHASASWKVTKPLRGAKKAMKPRGGGR